MKWVQYGSPTYVGVKSHNIPFQGLAQDTICILCFLFLLTTKVQNPDLIILDVMEILTRNKNIALSRDKLLELVWGCLNFYEVRHVTRKCLLFETTWQDLRTKKLNIKKAEHNIKYILLISGMG